MESKSFRNCLIDAGETTTKISVFNIHTLPHLFPGAIAIALTAPLVLSSSAIILTKN
ncbi:MAG: hypothetical protein WC765_09615 [Phycisphaerae bacterium]|jgi:hypothetical protein